MGKASKAKLIRNVAGAVAALVAARALLRSLRRVDLGGKTVLIVGGTRGLGLDLARELAAKKCKIALCARDPDEVARAREELERGGATVLASVCDATKEDEVKSFVEEAAGLFGGIDVLVTNAATIQVGPIEAMTKDDFEKALAQIFWAAYHPTMAVLPHMKARRWGRIVHITSFGGKIGTPHLLPYSTAKFATTGFSDGLRAELAKDGITVTTIAPGLMRTGSHVNVPVKGQHAKEYTWFTAGETSKLLAISSERAARMIVSAAEHGDAERTLSPWVRLATIAHAIAPGLVSSLTALQNQMLPSPEGGSRRPRRGVDIARSGESEAARLLEERDRANAERHLEYPGPVNVEPTAGAT